jgi:hypothetical protein
LQPGSGDGKRCSRCGEGRPRGGVVGARHQQ